MSASTPERNSPPKLPSFLSPSKQTLRVYDGKDWIPKPWSHDFEKYTLERLIHFQQKGAGLPEKVQANLVAINDNVESINSLNDELVSLRKEHLESISNASVETHTVHKGTIQDQKRFREITETRKEIIDLHNENLKLINRIYDQIDEYLEGIDEEIKTCQDKYVKEINSGEQERNAQIIKEQNARRRQEKLMREKRKAEMEALAKAGNGLADSVASQKLPEASASKRPPQASPRQSRQMQKLGFPQHKRRKKHKVNKAKKKQIMEELKDLNFIDEFDDDKSQRFEPTYCLCDSIAYGDMVCCSDRLCIKEWFHYECVGLKAPPDGKWICPDCRERKRREHEEKKKRRGF